MIMKCYDWMCQCYNKLTWRDTATKCLITLAILLYPFNQFPYGPFLKLMLIPLLGIFFLNIDRFLILWWKNKYLRFVAFAGVAWIVWMVIALPLAVGVDSISKDDIMRIVNEIKRFVPWYVFLMGCMLFDFEKLKRYIYWGFVGLFGYTALYAVIELLYFADIAWAKSFLETAVHYLMETCVDGGWWPPVFWTDAGEERCRSVFEEPAYYAILLVFCSLFFSYFAWIAKKWKGFVTNLLLAIIAIFFLHKTLSAAGAISFILAATSWVLVALCFVCKQEWKTILKMGILTLFFIIASFLTLTTQRHSSNTLSSMVKTATKTEQLEKKAEPVKVEKKAESAKVEKKSEPVKVEKKSEPVKVEKKFDKRRTNGRIIHLAAELNLIKASPLYGYGAGQYGRVMYDAVKEENKKYKSWEVNAWLKHKTVMHPLNRYTEQCVRHGIPGALLFISWLLFPIAFLWFKNLKKLSLEKLCIVVALSVFPACMMLSASVENFSYFFLLAFPVLFVTSATKNESKAS